jgi:hypothetical protein
MINRICVRGDGSWSIEPNVLYAVIASGVLTCLFMLYTVIP